MSDREEGGTSFFRGLILGVLAGMGLSYFFNTTDEGKRIKKKIKSQGKEAFKNLAEIIKELEEKGKEFQKRAKSLQSQLEEKAKSLRGEEIGESQKGFSQIKKLRERGRKAAKFFTRKGRPLKKAS